MANQVQGEGLSVDDDAVRSVAEKYTNVPLLPCFVVSLIGGSVNLGVAYLLKDYLPSFYALIMERGSIQFITVYAFWFALGMLIFKYRNLQRECAAFHLDFIKNFTAGHEILGTKTILGHHHVLSENLDPQQKNLILINRINKAIKQLRINNTPADVANVLKVVAETDAAVIDSSYVLIKFMIWAIPVLGFIGTVVGMTQAIASFDTVIKGISDVGFAGVQQGLGSVTSGLAVAFETTFLALVLSAVLNLLGNGLEKREEDLLSDIEEFTTDNIINKYSALRDRVQPSEMSAADPKPDKATMDNAGAMLRELRNMNHQNNLNTGDLLTQIGKLIEAIQGSPAPQMENEEAAQPVQDGLKPVLQEIRDILKNGADGRSSLEGEGPLPEEGNGIGILLTDVRKLLQDQAAIIRQVSMVTSLMEKNMEVMEKLPSAMEEMRQTSHKLGELFAKIYNRPFA